LVGRKLTGAFTLTRTGIRRRQNWLLLKLDDAPRLEPVSSGRRPQDM
jgi:hypothetical protein